MKGEKNADRFGRAGGVQENVRLVRQIDAEEPPATRCG